MPEMAYRCNTPTPTSLAHWDARRRCKPSGIAVEQRPVEHAGELQRTGVADLPQSAPTKSPAPALVSRWAHSPMRVSALSMLQPRRWVSVRCLGVEAAVLGRELFVQVDACGSPLDLGNRPVVPRYVGGER